MLRKEVGKVIQKLNAEVEILEHNFINLEFNFEKSCLLILNTSYFKNYSNFLCSKKSLNFQIDRYIYL